MLWTGRAKQALGHKHGLFFGQMCRLHRHKHRRCIVQAASTSARHRANADFANYGEYLYIEGLSELEKKRRKSAVIAEQKQQAEAAGFSFQPSISEKSRRMRANVSAPAWLRLSKHQSKFREERTLAIHSQNAEEAELAECTFKPQACSDMMLRHTLSMPCLQCS